MSVTLSFPFVFFQNKRLGSLNKFKAKARSILLATDVASRGLDIPHVDVVINFDIPTHSKVSLSVCQLRASGHHEQIDKEGEQSTREISVLLTESLIHDSVH